MQRMTGLGICLALPVMMTVAGCSSRPDEEEMKQLDDLKSEVASLQRDISTKEQQRGTLDREVADKNARVAKCNEDQQTVRQRLGRQ
jgi:septal ring factor EnvC (AmiA/AmiB activator)